MGEIYNNSRLNLYSSEKRKFNQVLRGGQDFPIFMSGILNIDKSQRTKRGRGKPSYKEKH